MRVFEGVDTLDDLLHAAYKALLDDGELVSASRGETIELRGVALELADPRSRLSRSEQRGRAVSAAGELSWYLSGSADLDHITHYIPRYSELIGGEAPAGSYGPRLFGSEGQVAPIIRLLQERPSTRQAVVQLFDVQDLSGNPRDVPCTCTLQFILRNGFVELVTHMRSNDAYLGLPHDLFAFTMLQEIVARALGAEPGRYTHFVGSMHIYQSRVRSVRAYLNEGYFAPKAMPPMPLGNPFPGMSEFIESERAIRAGLLTLEDLGQGYWDDLARLTIVQRVPKHDLKGDLTAIRESFTDDYYRIYVSDRQVETAARELGEA